jgi:hypothetical protein
MLLKEWDRKPRYVELRGNPKRGKKMITLSYGTKT